MQKWNASAWPAVTNAAASETASIGMEASCVRLQKTGVLSPANRDRDRSIAYMPVTPRGDNMVISIPGSEPSSLQKQSAACSQRDGGGLLVMESSPAIR